MPATVSGKAKKSLVNPQKKKTQAKPPKNTAALRGGAGAQGADAHIFDEDEEYDDDWSQSQTQAQSTALMHGLVKDMLTLFQEMESVQARFQKQARALMGMVMTHGFGINGELRGVMDNIKTVLDKGVAPDENSSEFKALVDSATRASDFQHRASDSYARLRELEHK